MSNRILLIDFDARTLAKWQEVLGEPGYDVVCAKNSAEVAKQLDAALRPGLVILEPMMPGLDGFSLCRTLKSTTAGRPPAVIIASRIYRGQKYRGFARDAGADLFVEKPIGDAELLELVSRWVDPDTTILRQARAARPAAAAPVNVTAPTAAQKTTPSSSRTIPIQALRPEPTRAPQPAPPLGLDAGPETGIDLGSVTDDDIDDALSRLSLGGLDEPSPVPSAASPDALAETPPAGSPAEADFSADDLAQALDRLELTNDADEPPSPDAEDADTALIEVSRDDDDPSGPASRSKDTGETALAAPPGGDDPPFFVRPQPGRSEEGSPLPLARNSSFDAPPGLAAESALGPRTGDDADLTLAGLASGAPPLDAPAEEASRTASPLPPPHDIASPAGEYDPGDAPCDAAASEPPSLGDGAALPLPPWRDPDVPVSHHFAPVDIPVETVEPSAPISERGSEEPVREALDQADDALAIDGIDGIDDVSEFVPPVDQPVHEESRLEAAHEAREAHEAHEAHEALAAIAQLDDSLIDEIVARVIENEPVESLGAEPVALPGTPASEDVPGRPARRADDRDAARPAAPLAAPAASRDEPSRSDRSARGDEAHESTPVEEGPTDLVAAIDQVLRLAPRGGEGEPPAAGSAGTPAAMPGPARADIPHLPGGAQPAHDASAPGTGARIGALRGMDPQTAELLSTLEELEDSLPHDAPVPLASLAADLADVPPTREQERDLDSVIEKVTGRQAAASVAGVPLAKAAAAADVAQAVTNRRNAAADAYYEEILAGTSSRRTGLWISVLLGIIVIGGSILGFVLFTGRGIDGAIRAPAPAARSAPTESAARSDVAHEPGSPTPDEPAVRAVPDAPPESTADAAPTPREAPPSKAVPSRPQPAPASGRAAAARPAPKPTRQTTTIGGVRGSIPPAPEPLDRSDSASGAVPVVPLAEIDRPLKILEYERPAMPGAARRAAARGRVFVQVLIGPEGRVLDTKSLMDPGYGLAAAAEASVRGWRYSRPSRDLEPVRVWKTEVVEFEGAE